MAWGLNRVIPERSIVCLEHKGFKIYDVKRLARQLLEWGNHSTSEVGRVGTCHISE